MSRLIVNADDFGYTAGVNEAIVSLFEARALSSTTVMATGDALPESAGALPAGLGTGCHVVLVDGRAASAGGADGTDGTDGGDSSLLGADGRSFRPTLGRFVADLQMCRVSEQAIEVEAVAQIRALQARGFRVTHVDTHKHTHMFPRVLRPLLRAALACGVRAVRNPFEPEWARAATLGAPWLRSLEMRVLAGYRRGFVRDVEQAGMRTTEGALGVLATGVLDGWVLEALLGALARHGGGEDCYELVCHPGVDDAALRAQRTRLLRERAVEFAVLGQVVPRWFGVGGGHRLVGFDGL